MQQAGERIDMGDQTDRALAAQLGEEISAATWRLSAFMTGARASPSCETNAASSSPAPTAGRGAEPAGSNTCGCAKANVTAGSGARCSARSNARLGTGVRAACAHDAQFPGAWLLPSPWLRGGRRDPRLPRRPLVLSDARAVRATRHGSARSPAPLRTDVSRHYGHAAVAARVCTGGLRSHENRLPFSNGARAGSMYGRVRRAGADGGGWPGVSQRARPRPDGGARRGAARAGHAVDELLLMHDNRSTRC
jgi:hypothetical protein